MSSAPLLPATVREMFRLPAGAGYLMAHSVGAQPRMTADAMAAHYLEPWATKAAGAWEDWLTAIDAFRSTLARFIGAVPAELCPQPGVSVALDRYLGSLPLPYKTGRRTILLSAESFASIGYVASAAQGLGYVPRLLEGSPDAIESWAAAINDDTAIVLPMHVYSNSGRVAPVADIAQLARQSGAKCVVDVAQSIGILPVAPREWGVDALIGSCVKWLSGGPGAGWLWVPEAAIPELYPRSVGWWSHEAPFEMDIHNFRYAPDALRFWGGTPDIAPFIAARAGIETIASIGQPAIRSHNQSLQASFLERMRVQKPQWQWPEHLIGGTICVGLGDDKDGVAARMAEAGFQADYRSDMMRLSFAAWTSSDEVSALTEVLA